MKIKLNLKETENHSIIPAEQYGHFAEHLGRCIYGGIWSEKRQDYNENVVSALKKLDIPVLRWPGGCFADTYHWRDGIGAPETRPQTINTVWGWVPETNRFGTHEFFALCEILGAKPYLAGNMGSGTVQELADWVHYCTSDLDTALTRERRANGRVNAWKLPYVGIGNEAWGGGGLMSADYYTDCYRQWQGFVKSYDFSTPMQKIACGPNSDDYAWTERMMQRVDSSMMQGLALHYYTVPSGVWEKKGDAVRFSEDEYLDTIRRGCYMDELLTKHSAVMDKYDPEKKIALAVDEWGAWYDTEKEENPAFLYQQNTMRDAILAAMTLHIFHRHTDRVKMANLAQAVNVLQALILTRGEQVVCTPTYHVFEMFRHHQNAHLLDISGDIGEENGLPQVSVIASRRDGETLITLCNPQLSPQVVEIGVSAAQKNVSARLLHDVMTACNDFDTPERVKPMEITHQLEISENAITLTLPPVSVAAVIIR